MTRSLLDVNVLLALLDADHVNHAAAWAWFDGTASQGWASCAITENGFIRVISQPRYPSPVAAVQAVQLLADARAGGDHAFWPCDVSALDASTLDARRVHGPRQLTDAYLLALAAAHGGRFVSFDRRISPAAVPGATEANLLTL